MININFDSSTDLNQTQNSPNASFKVKPYQIEEKQIQQTTKEIENNIKTVNQSIEKHRSRVYAKSQDWLQQTIELKDKGRKSKQKLDEHIELKKKLQQTLKERQNQSSIIDTQIFDLKRLHKGKRETHRVLSDSIDSLKLKIAKKKDALKQLQKRYDTQRGLNIPELNIFENKLGFTLDSDIDGNLIMSFTKINETKPNQIYSLMLDVSQKQYQALNCSPMVPNLDSLIEELNSSRDLFHFIKQLRKSFHTLTKN